MMDINEIRNKYNAGDYTYKVTIPAKVSIDHVFDEELSVKRNRELAAEHNYNIDIMQKDKRMKQRDLDKQLTKDVVDYITENYSLNREQARIVESFIFEEKHACMYDYFEAIDTFASFADDLVNYGTEDKREE